MARHGAIVIYRLIVHGRGGSSALRGRLFDTLRAAHSAAAALLRGDAGGAIHRIDVQRGVRVNFACHDAYAGGAPVDGHYAWDTVEALEGELLDELRSLSAARQADVRRRAVPRTRLLVGVLATIAFALVALGMHAPSLVGVEVSDLARRADAIAQLPITRQPPGEAADESGPSPRSALRAPLDAADCETGSAGPTSMAGL